MQKVRRDAIDTHPAPPALLALRIHSGSQESLRRTSAATPRPGDCTFTHQSTEMPLVLAKDLDYTFEQQGLAFVPSSHLKNKII